MKSSWNAFKKDRLFLTKYLGSHFILLVVLNAIFLHNFKDLNADFRFLPYLPVALVLGIVIPVFMHNCMHANHRSKLLDEVFGELAALFALMSLGVLRINHMLHHVHADQDGDPHSPQEKSFLSFFFTGQFSGSQEIKKRYLEFHGDTKTNRLIFGLNIFLHYGGQPLRLILWCLLLGPSLFVFIYLPAFVTYSLAFAHVNYVTHRTHADGYIEIIYLDHNFYYKFINFIGSGVYYHKNHHRSPRLLNPKYLKKRASL